MNSPRSPWNRLVAAARLAPVDTRDVSAPPGFATRVTALAFAAGGPPSVATMLARLSWRALGVAALLMLVSIAANFKPLLTALDRDSAAVLNDPVGEWLDNS